MSSGDAASDSPKALVASDSQLPASLAICARIRSTSSAATSGSTVAPPVRGSAQDIVPSAAPGWHQSVPSGRVRASQSQPTQSVSGSRSSRVWTLRAVSVNCSHGQNVTPTSPMPITWMCTAAVSSTAVSAVPV